MSLETLSIEDVSGEWVIAERTRAPARSRRAMLTCHVYPGGSPVWSPDGRKIVVVSDGDVHVMNADGSGKRKLNPAN